jgi:type I restriction enzyme R subunit
MNRYINDLITNQEVIDEMLHIAKKFIEAQAKGNELGLSAEELAFYDALTKPEAVKDFYTNEQLIALTKELTETLRKNQTIDWQKKKSARAQMRRMIKRLLKKYYYPPEETKDALETVISQCELWTDNVMYVNDVY